MSMNWYDTFNAIEAGLWGMVAAVILCRTASSTRQQRGAVVLAGLSFVTFGVTDLLEIGTDGLMPLWLWGCKVACGAAILSARYTWLGWDRFRWRDREVLFGLACLVAVVVLIVLQITEPGTLK
jgi:hypothetical protein